MTFDFGVPKTIQDDDYNVEIVASENKSILKYNFKRTVKPLESERCEKDNSTKTFEGLWRCSTCFTENLICTVSCRSCSNLSNADAIILTKTTKLDKNRRKRF